MSKTNTLNRRLFLRNSAAAAAAFTIVPRHVLGGAGQSPPSEKLNIAGIGIGGMGASNLQNVAGENIVALCDVDDEYAAKTFAAYPNAKKYRDWRKMLDERKDIDAVVIATPDHTHAVIAMAAIKAGKHVYCQKPLTHNIYESRMLTEAARRAGVVTQMGIQGHSSSNARMLCEIVRSGAIGMVRQVQAWSTLSYYPWGHAWWSTTHSTRPDDKPPVPDSLDWDLWLGPAQERPYHPCYHPAKWRAWWDFGCGMLGDRGVHTFDPIFWALNLKYPVSVQAVCVGGNQETHPLATIVTYQFPARGGDLPPVTLTWYDGMEPPRPDELEDGRVFGGAEGGILLKGENGKIMSGYMADSPRLIPESKMKDFQRPPESIPRVNGTHEQDWVDAIKNNRRAGADFDYSGPLTETVLLGNIAKRISNCILKWDGENIKILNEPKANEYIRRQYRQGWSL
ncbi:MAG: Gfo/Idh/MocA family oxidoreductase [Planctomycetota bacterium]|nr:Gfo/Idh/MocA family oxidoreductase [Planctomycetota bacterium]